MPPTLVIVRHAEALHNNYQLHDPELSYLGIQQCGALRLHLQQNLPIADQIELIVASPMKRTLQTAQYAFSWLVKRGVPILPRPEWQENSDKPCDTGSKASLLAREFDTIDFSTLDPLYPKKEGLYAYEQDAVLERGLQACKALRHRSEKVIAVVSHSAFLRTAVAHARFANADYRVFDFAEDEHAASPLVERKWSASRGGGMGRSPVGRMTIEPGDFSDGGQTPTR